MGYFMILRVIGGSYLCFFGRKKLFEKRINFMNYEENKLLIVKINDNFFL